MCEMNFKKDEFLFYKIGSGMSIIKSFKDLIEIKRRSLYDNNKNSIQHFEYAQE